MGNQQVTFRSQLARSLRTQRGSRSQIDFAKRLAISQSTLARIEHEEQNVTIDMLELICQRLKCSLSELIPETK